MRKIVINENQRAISFKDKNLYKAVKAQLTEGQDINTEYCVLDLETTGISNITEKITEVGIIKIKNGEIIEEYETFVNPEKPIPEEVVEVTVDFEILAAYDEGVVYLTVYRTIALAD